MLHRQEYGGRVENSHLRRVTASKCWAPQHAFMGLSRILGSLREHRIVVEIAIAVREVTG